MANKLRPNISDIKCANYIYFVNMVDDDIIEDWTRIPELGNLWSLLDIDSYKRRKADRIRDGVLLDILMFDDVVLDSKYGYYAKTDKELHDYINFQLKTLRKRDIAVYNESEDIIAWKYRDSRIGPDYIDA